MSTDAVNEFLLSGGVPAAKFETPGTAVTGKIVHLKVEQQREFDSSKPKFWDDGTPQMQIVCHLQTTQRDASIPDDDGVRALYIRNQMKAAVSSAIRKAGTGLEPGGVLTVTYSRDGERKAAGLNPPKLYAATYTPAVKAAVDGALGGPAPHAAPAALPPGVTAEQWANLDDAERAVLAKLHDLPPF